MTKSDAATREEPLKHLNARERIARLLKGEYRVDPSAAEFWNYLKGMGPADIESLRQYSWARMESIESEWEHRDQVGIPFEDEDRSHLQSELLSFAQFYRVSGLALEWHLKFRAEPPPFSKLSDETSLLLSPAWRDESAKIDLFQRLTEKGFVDKTGPGRKWRRKLTELGFLCNCLTASKVLYPLNEGQFAVFVRVEFGVTSTDTVLRQTWTDAHHPGYEKDNPKTPIEKRYKELRQIARIR